MTDHPLKTLIEAADRAITAEDFDTLMDFYTEDAVLVIAPGRLATGKAEIRDAFVAIAAYFGNNVRVSQGDMQVLEGGDTALVIMETFVHAAGPDGQEETETRRATYVFRRDGDTWRCAVDNSYGTTLLDQGVPPAEAR